MQCIVGVRLKKGLSVGKLRKCHEVNGWKFLELVQTEKHGKVLLFSKPASAAVPALSPRKMSSGLAQRTLKNLDFIKESPCMENVHPVTQVVNSLLSLLVFPVEQGKSFFDNFSSVVFPVPSCSDCGGVAPDLPGIKKILAEKFALSSLEVAKFQGCPTLSRFFKRLRNAIAHKNLEFSQPDSQSLRDVTVTLMDKPRNAEEFDWEISMTAEDLEKIGRFVATEVIGLGL